ncbi:MAG: hypothetical protein JSV52_13520 [Candidatus Zixiibacteriota bacterium]|nr:MAG: hypothetical protein JSV52_13520 [candidate division Zixibacteria bacterium]
MESYREFPVWIVLYNLITFAGVLIMGVIIALQFPVWVLIAYLVLLVLVAVCLPAVVCSRCGYYGHRCAMGVGKLVKVLFRKRHEEEFFRTKLQLVVVALYLLALLLPFVGSIWLFADRYSTAAFGQLLIVSVFLLAALAPHTKLACAHCRQGECSLCPLGRIIWKRP